MTYRQVEVYEIMHPASLEPDARFTCPARKANPKVNQTDGLDYWMDRGPDRVCSFCASMRPPEFIDWCVRCVERDSLVRVEPGDVNGKWWIHRKGITHAGQGAIKAYWFHFPKEEVRESEILSWNLAIGNAVEVSVARAPAPKAVRP